MALNAAITLNYRQMSAGQNPPPKATLTVYNPNATAVAVTGIRLKFTDVLGGAVQVPANMPEPMMSPGQTTSVPALGSITFGPFPVVVASAASGPWLTGPVQRPLADPVPRQAAHKPQVQYFVGAVVYGSDNSINEASRSGLMVSFAILPPRYSQGGIAQFNGVNNANLVGALVG